jgi:hypothetical protein
MTDQHRHHPRVLAPALAALCLALPASATAIPQIERATDPPSPAFAPKIGDTPADFGAPASPAPKNGDTPADYPGMPGTPSAPATSASAPPLAEASSSDGFDWASAAIGAGGAGLLVVLSLGGVTLASHGRLPHGRLRSTR